MSKKYGINQWRPLSVEPESDDTPVQIAPKSDTRCRLPVQAYTHDACWFWSIPDEYPAIENRHLYVWRPIRETT